MLWSNISGEISEMRRLFDAGHPIADLSRKSSVHRSVASQICNRKTSVDVPDDLEPIVKTPIPATASRRAATAR